MSNQAGLQNTRLKEPTAKNALMFLFLNLFKLRAQRFDCAVYKQKDMSLCLIRWVNKYVKQNKDSGTEGEHYHTEYERSFAPVCVCV